MLAARRLSYFGDGVVALDGANLVRKRNDRGQDVHDVVQNSWPTHVKPVDQRQRLYM